MTRSRLSKGGGHDSLVSFRFFGGGLDFRHELSDSLEESSSKLMYKELFAAVVLTSFIPVRLLSFGTIRNICISSSDDAEICSSTSMFDAAFFGGLDGG